MDIRATLEQRIATLTEEREAYRRMIEAEANRQLAAFDGAITECRHLLQLLTPAPDADAPPSALDDVAAGS
jgi:uncharacterized coiled-coil protein SlyX